MKLWLDLEEEKGLKQQLDFKQSQSRKSAETICEFGRSKKFETTDGLPTIRVPKSVETMARFVRGKEFETPDGFPTIPVQKKC